MYDDDAEKGKFNLVKSNWRHLEHVPGAKIKKIMKLTKKQMKSINYRDMCKDMGLDEGTHVFCFLMELEEKLEMRERYESSHDSLTYPTSFWECLLQDDWKEWLEAIRKEMECWIENGTFEITDVKDLDPDTPIIDLGELYLIKRSGKYKHRLFAKGYQQRSKDYMETTAETINSSIFRLCAGLSVTTGREIKGGDVITAYLLSEQRKPCAAWPPSHLDYVFADATVLYNLRKKLKENIKKDPNYLKLITRKDRHKSGKVLRLLKAVYGTKDAGNSFKHLKEFAFEEAGAKRLWSDKSVFYFSEPKNDSDQQSYSESGEEDWFLLWSHTDDFGYFGSSDEYEEKCKKKIEKYLKMEWDDNLKDYTSMKIRQCTEKGLLEFTQPEYWERLANEFQIDKRITVKTPLPPTTDFEVSTEELHEAAKHLPYQNLVGAMLYPAVMCKLEMKHALSLLGAHMHNYTKQHYELALHCLQYGYTTRNMGLIFSRGLDPHGVDKIYTYCDAAFGGKNNDPRSIGCHTCMLNGCAFLHHVKKHTTIDTSSTMAELHELFKASIDVAWVRNFMEEIGMKILESTVVYEDNQPSIRICEGVKTASAVTTKSMNIKSNKVQEMVDDQQINVKWMSTVNMISDIGTKVLPAKQFQFLRDVLNGYGLAYDKYPEWFEGRGLEKFMSYQRHMIEVHQLKLRKIKAKKIKSKSIKRKSESKVDMLFSKFASKMRLKKHKSQR